MHDEKKAAMSSSMRPRDSCWASRVVTEMAERRAEEVARLRRCEEERR